MDEVQGEIVVEIKEICVRMKAYEEAERMQVLTFILGGVRYGIPIEAVQSVERDKKTESIPETLPCIKGIMNLHGRVIPIYSLAEKFGYKNQKVEELVVVKASNFHIGIEICMVQEILNVEEKNVVPMPRMIGGFTYIPKVVNHNKTLIEILDIEQLITEEELQHIQNILDKKD